MKQKVKTYILLTICLLSFLLDMTFVLRAFYQSQKLVLVETTVNSIVVDKYRAITKIPIIEVSSTENTPERVYQKFGSYSLRWLFQTIPQEQDRINYYKLDYEDGERGDYVVGIGINQRCSSFKLWLDIYASYAYNTISFMLNIIAVFAVLTALGKHWEYDSLNIYFNGLVIYSFLKMIIYAVVIS